MFYTVYKIINLLNGKEYIGMHQTANLDDGYMGSGLAIKRAIRKYGQENFSKEILFVFGDETQMREKEQELVTETYITQPNVYNIKLGGLGGFVPFFNLPTDAKIRRRVASKRNGELARDRKTGIHNLTDDERHLIGVAGWEARKQLYPNGLWSGRTHREESKQAIGEANSILQAGEKNSQFGTIWITNGIESRKIIKTELIPVGFVKGRIVKVNTKCQICECDTGSVRAKYCKTHLTEHRTRTDLDPTAVLTDYENGMPMQQMLAKYNWKSEQNIVGYLNKRFPNRRRFKSGERVNLN